MLDKMITVSVRSKDQPIHWHETLELNYVIRGSMTVLLNNREIEVGTDEIMTFNIDDVHSVTANTEDLVYIQLEFSLKHFEQYIPEISSVIVKCSPETDNAIETSIKDELKYYIANTIKLLNSKNISTETENRIIYNAQAILFNLKQTFSYVEGVSRLSSDQIDRLWKVIDYMYDNSYRKLPLNEVAKLVYVSNDYLTKFLKRSIGMGFEEFLAFIRAENSVKLLLNTDMSITAISAECGFSAPKYYYSTFESLYGCLPGEYREKNRSKFGMNNRKIIPLLEYESEEIKKITADVIKGYDEGSGIVRNVSFDIENLKNAQIRKSSIIPASRRNMWTASLFMDVAGMPSKYFVLDESVFAWEENNEICVLAFNISDEGKIEYDLEISGLDTGYIYVYCKERSVEIPKTIRDIVEEGRPVMGSSFLEGAFSKNYEYGEFSGRNKMVMEFNLSYEQYTKVTIQKYKLNK